MENVAVVGASPKEDRYSHKAMVMLEENGHHAIPVSPTGTDILGKKGYRLLTDVPEKIDTVTVYIGAARQTDLLEQLIAVKPRRAIFPPGAENPSAYGRLKETGIQVYEDCPLVMLRTGRF